VSPTELTSIGALVVAAVSAIVLPIVFKRQTTKQLKAEREETAKQAARQQEITTIREQAQRDAAATAGDTVTWEKMNRALATTAAEERAAHQERILELRTSFTVETERLKRQTDHEMDRAKEEIGRLSVQVQQLTQRLAELVPRGER